MGVLAHSDFKGLEVKCLSVQSNPRKKKNQKDNGEVEIQTLWNPS